MNNKFTSSVSGASFFIAAIGLFSKGTGFLREVLFASIYGLSTDFDIYLIGAVLPVTINIIILSLGQNYLIPTYNKLNEIQSKKAINFIRLNLYLFIIAGIFISVTLFTMSDFIISSFISDADTETISSALLILNLFLFTIPITCGISVIIAYQQGNFEFKYSVVSHVIPNMTVLVTVFYFGSSDVIAIPAGFIIGALLQFIFLASKSLELFKIPDESPLSVTKYLATGFFSIIIIVLIESIGQLYVIADRYFYDSISSGGISALSYAQTIFLLPITILSIALSTAIFPRFSHLYNKNKLADLEKLFNDGLVINIVIFIPVMFIFLFFGDIVMQIIYERGNFSNYDTLITSNALAFYSISIVFYSAYGILNKLIYSIGVIKNLLVITIFGIFIKIVLNYLLVDPYHQNGLALSTTISYLFFFFASLKLLKKRLAINNKLFFFRELVYHLIIGLVAILITKIIGILLPQCSYIGLFEIFVFSVVYLLNLLLLKNPFIQVLIQLVKNISSSVRQ